MTESRKEYLRNYLRAYRKTHPEYAARQRECRRKYYQEHREQILAKLREKRTMKPTRIKFTPDEIAVIHEYRESHCMSYERLAAKLGTTYYRLFNYLSRGQGVLIEDKARMLKECGVGI